MAKIALTVMRVHAQLRNGTIMVVTEPHGIMIKDIRDMHGTAGTVADMPGSHSVIVTRGKEPQHIYTAHALTDLIGAVSREQEGGQGGPPQAAASAGAESLPGRGWQ